MCSTGRPVGQAARTHCRWPPLQLHSTADPGSPSHLPQEPQMTAMTLDTTFGPRSRGARSAPTVRLTRRGRLVVLLAALLVAFAVGVFVTAAGSVATQE